MVLSSSSNCNYAVGSGVTSICAKTCWRLQQKLYSKRCLAEPSQFRLAGVGKWLTGTRCSLCFLDLQTRKNFISTARNDQKKEHHGIATKKEKKIEVRRNLTFDGLCIKDVFHKCQRRHARFPVGRDVYVHACVYVQMIANVVFIYTYIIVIYIL